MAEVAERLRPKLAWVSSWQLTALGGACAVFVAPELGAVGK